MMDGRRHSVDIPISRTLIALRRVRSLRDPSTNSMSKFSNLLENVNWETDSMKDISLHFMNGYQGGGSDHNGLSGLGNVGHNEQREEQIDDFELQCDLGKFKSKLILCEKGGVENTGARTRMKHAEGLDDCALNEKEIHGNKSLSDRYYSNNGDRRLGLTCITPLRNGLEDVDSTNDPVVGSPQADNIDQSVARWRSQCKHQVKASELIGDVLSCAGSPCMSNGDFFSSHRTPLFADEEADYVSQTDRGCGISCCWTITPRLYSDAEGHPSLSKDMSETTSYGQRIWKHITNETPRSFIQKFRPKSFAELVGQNVVVKSLLGAISLGRITSLYVFHGPRGTGKTSASRIFAAALNCLSLDEYKPCGLCRECVLFFSGRCMDVKEVDSVRINQTEKIRSLINNASIPPISSQFKVFIIDECHLLHAETWANILNNLEKLSQHVVFVMITPDLDKLPRNALSHSQRYHFPKIKDTDITSRLETICVEECLDFDKVALEFIAAKSNGSLRDAEMMLDQLSLLGQRVTMSLAYELIGVVSDDELLDLLDMALSSDTSKTVIRARELMRSRIDPMQLVSQLANLIMDILSGKWQDDSSEVRKMFSRKHASEVDMQRLSQALKILSETEKQLRMSKHQSTWLTVALLQLSSLEFSSSDANDSRSSLRNGHDGEGDFFCTSSTGESLKHLVSCSCEDGKFHKLEVQGDCKATLECIWKRTTELCQSNSLKKFLMEHGKLSFLSVKRGLAIAELDFNHPSYVSKAEKSWKLIASSLQSVLGCNVEIRINPVLSARASKCAKLRNLSFSLFSCSRRMQKKSQLPMEYGSDFDYPDDISEKPMIGDETILTCSSDRESQMSCNCNHGVPVIRALRNSEGNVITVGTISSHKSFQGRTAKTHGYGFDSSKQKANNLENEALSGQETDYRANCFPRTLRLQKKLSSLESSQVICQQENKIALSILREKPFEACECSNDFYVFSSNNHTNDFKSNDGQTKNSIRVCWRTPTFPVMKAWQLIHKRRKSPLFQWILPCAAAK